MRVNHTKAVSGASVESFEQKQQAQHPLSGIKSGTGKHNANFCIPVSIHLQVDG
jgi:hypothetical protein